MSESLTQAPSTALERSTQAQVPSHTAARGDAPLAEFYDIEGAASFVKAHNFRSIALQFPDWMLSDAFDIVDKLDSLTDPSTTFVILADTSYREDCVDEVAAQHINAECVIHYGPATIAEPSHMPVYYDLCRAPINIEAVASSFVAALDDVSAGCAIVLADSAWQHAVQAVAQHVQTALSQSRPDAIHIVHTVAPHIRWPRAHEASADSADASGTGGAAHAESSSAAGTTAVLGGAEAVLPPGVQLSDCVLLYIGSVDSTALRVLQLTHSSSTMLLAQPQALAGTAKDVTGGRTREIMQRFALIQRGKLASTFGVVVGTLGVAHYAKLVNAAEALIRAAGATVYTFVVGKLNVPKLGNFSEIDAYVLVDHPQGAVLPAEVAREFHAPILTPYELALALRPELQWTGNLVLDFSQLLEGVFPPPATAAAAAAGAAAAGGDQAEGSDSDEPFWSPVTGQYEQSASQKRAGALAAAGLQADSTAVVDFQPGGALSKYDPSTAAGKFASREWGGMSADVPADAPRSIVQGQVGIARKYAGEGGASDAQ